ncbi:hypothetical protein F383_38402 [Gossypium arboreum]|uniref:Uncharacterized protein n=1 Tax=Gossypium arboreum TaxID=29729 RepID=A0A0B0MIY0_GOSAR|nr:hypothetical protein F383_38402 [Gossypium arboreum]
MKKMDPRGKSTRPGLPHTSVSHGHVHLVGSKHDLHRRVTRACPCRAQV